MKTPHWQGQSAIVTGASSGIGSAIAIDLARAGAQLVLTGRRQQALEGVASRCRELGGTAHTLACDLTVPEAREELSLLARRAYGALDLLVNNAGVTMNARFSELDPQVLRTILEVNFFAAADLTRIVLPDLIARRGRILVISSVTGLVGTPTRTVYAASKHALHGLYEGLRVELRDHGVGVTIACPGYVATPMRERALLADGSLQGHDQAAGRRMLAPEEVSQRALRAAWHRKRLVKMGTETYLARALSLVAPGLLERILARATR